MKALSQLTAEADAIFSEYIRKRNADSFGMVHCHICGTPLPWKQAECSHFISRNKLGTRYEEDNACESCHDCNIDHNDNREPYTMWILKNLPTGTIPELIRKSMMFISSLDHRILLNDVIKKYKRNL